MQRVADEAIKRHGRYDVWVNNAGRGISRPVSQLTDEDLDDMLKVNVKSALYGMQISAAYFKGAGKGQILNVSSMLGRVPAAPTGGPPRPSASSCRRRPAARPT